MNILAIGDVVGKEGCDFLRKHLPALKKLYDINLCIVNGENSAQNNGITPATAEHIFASGADVITTGNHVFRHKEIFDYLDENSRILRPANYPDSAPGKGYCIVDTGRVQVCVINLMGTVFMDSLDNPFHKIDHILNEIGPDCIPILDFHAEATSEKKAMGFYLDGRASIVFGTHTHVQTNDDQVLPKGTGYITDLGMTGPQVSVLGVEPDCTIRRFVTKMPVRFTHASGPCIICGAVFGINYKNKSIFSINKIRIE